MKYWLKSSKFNTFNDPTADFRRSKGIDWCICNGTSD